MSEYVGLDVSKEETAFCVKDADGTILARGKTATDPQALFEVLKEHCLCPGRIVMETGTLSGWLARRVGQAGHHGRCDRRSPGARGDASSAQQDGRQRRRVTGRDRTHRVLPSGYGEERDGAGEASSSQGARPSGGCAARHGEHGPGSSGVVGPALSQRLGQTGDAGPRGAGGPSRAGGDDRASAVRGGGVETRERTAGCGGPGTGEGRSGVPLA